MVWTSDGPETTDNRNDASGTAGAGTGASGLGVSSGSNVGSLYATNGHALSFTSTASVQVPNVASPAKLLVSASSDDMDVVTRSASLEKVREHLHVRLPRPLVCRRALAR